MIPCPDMIYSPANTASPPDARWHRGRLAAEGDDGWVTDRWAARAYAYASDLRDGVPTRDPEVAAAHALRASPDRLARGEVEARVLAGQSDADVAAACALTEAVVAAYVALYFDVRRRLRAKMWVATFAIGPRIYDGTLAESDCDLIVKKIAYLRGPVALEWVLSYYRHGISLPTALGELTRDELAGLRDRLGVRALVLAWVLPFERCGRVFRLQELEREVHALVEAWPADAASPPAVLTDVWPAFSRLFTAASGEVRPAA